MWIAHSNLQENLALRSLVLHATEGIPLRPRVNGRGEEGQPHHAEDLRLCACILMFIVYVYECMRVCVSFVLRTPDGKASLQQ